MTRRSWTWLAGIAGGLSMLLTALWDCARAAEVDVQPLRLEVPVFRRVTTHVHRPADLKPGEKRPAVLLIGEPGCKLAGALAARQRLVATHFSPAEHPLRPRASGKRDGQVVPRQAAST